MLAFFFLLPVFSQGGCAYSRGVVALKITNYRIQVPNKTFKQMTNLEIEICKLSNDTQSENFPR